MNKVVAKPEKNIVPLGEFVLLKEASVKSESGGVLLAESAMGDKKYEVVNIGAEADTELEVGDVVFVQSLDLITISLGEKKKFLITKCKNIIGYEE